jgi:hypothetical protein
MWKQLLLLQEYYSNIIKMSKSTNQTGLELPSAEAVLVRFLLEKFNFNIAKIQKINLVSVNSVLEC